MDIRLGSTTPTPSSRIAVSSPERDRHFSGNETGSWSFGNQTSHQNHNQSKTFGWIADGARDAAPSESDAYLTASYEQYDRSSRVENPSSAGEAAPVQTFVLDRTEGGALDIRA